MSQAEKVSLCIITFNEESNLEDCLASAAWVDEKVVVDSGSTDRTLEIAEAFGCKIIRQEFLGHVKQKDLAVRAASHRWVICLDGDERLAPGAEQEVRSTLATEEGRSVAGYAFPRHTFYLGGWINHSGWWPEYRLRLFDRERGHWTGTDPHDRVEVEGPQKKLTSEITHFNYRDISHHIQKVNDYTQIMADRRYDKGVGASLWKMLLNPPARFFRMYLLRRGFLDGRRGLVIAVIGAFYVFLKYAKLWERSLKRKP